MEKNWQPIIRYLVQNWCKLLKFFQALGAVQCSSEEFGHELKTFWFDNWKYFQLLTETIYGYRLKIFLVNKWGVHLRIWLTTENVFGYELFLKPLSTVLKLQWSCKRHFINLKTMSYDLWFNVIDTTREAWEKISS